MQSGPRKRRPKKPKLLPKLFKEIRVVFKSGYVAIIGKPNVGKSTLINAILGERLSIVTHKAQTTRHKITGILNSDDAQIVFLDTPGYHVSKKSLNQAMNEVVDMVINDADVICLMLSADEKDEDIEKELYDRINKANVLVVINKADLVDKSSFADIARRYKDQWNVSELVFLSAKRKEGVSELVDMIKERLPEGPAYFPDDLYTNHSVRFMVSELIREEVFLQLRQEVPYSTAIVIEEFKEAESEGAVTKIHATIMVEKDSQKSVVIGKGGQQIKSIGKKAREKIEELVGTRVYLELFVRVQKDWSRDMHKVREFLGS